MRDPSIVDPFQVALSFENSQLVMSWGQTATAATALPERSIQAGTAMPSGKLMARYQKKVLKGFGKFRNPKSAQAKGG